MGPAFALVLAAAEIGEFKRQRLHRLRPGLGQARSVASRGPKATRMAWSSAGGDRPMDHKGATVRALKPIPSVSALWLLAASMGPVVSRGNGHRRVRHDGGLRLLTDRW